MKAFHENSKFTFIIIGVWLEENRLIALNGDLSGRVKSVNAEKWSNEQLKQLINDGEFLLNISFPETFKQQIIEQSLNNVYIVQEVCYNLCVLNKIIETQTSNIEIDCRAVLMKS